MGKPYAPVQKRRRRERYVKRKRALLAAQRAQRPQAAPKSGRR
jgi:hypothetical protein